VVGLVVVGLVVVGLVVVGLVVVGLVVVGLVVVGLEEVARLVAGVEVVVEDGVVEVLGVASSCLYAIKMSYIRLASGAILFL